MNVHVTLLHAAIAKETGENAPVRRVRESDLYAQEITDEGELYWLRRWYGQFRPDQPMPEDGLRMGDVSEGPLVDALDWLDSVVAADVLIPFDLMNQSQVAAIGNDFASAVVTGWSVCEQRLRSLSRQVGHDHTANAKKLVARLASQGVVSHAERSVLDGVRDARNKWLHGAVEPTLDDANDAVQAAAQLLARDLPGFMVNTTVPRLVLL